MTQLCAPRFILVMIMATVVESQVVCYQCYANSTSAGKFCSIDSLCTGSSCFFNIDPTGSWSAGCSSSSTSQAALSCSITGTETVCGCTGDFCNRFENANVTAHSIWPNTAPFSTLQLAWPPGEMITCQECGNLTIGGLVRDIPCNEQNLCQGNYCVTKRGQTPHSYCGSEWEGTSTVACFKKPGEDEQCVCPQQMCNAVLPTEKLQSSSTVTTTAQTTVTTTLMAILTSSTSTTMPTPVADPVEITTTKPLVKKCKSNIKFSPNAQAVMMGQKLKDVIMNGFGTGAQAVSDDIDTHICVYSNE